jgi:hypothetical protein
MLTRVVNVHEKSYDIYIGRPTIWGNPFRIGKDGTREEVIQKYRDRIMNSKRPEFRNLARKALRGKTLGCYCKPLPCHGDVLAEIAETEWE